MSAKMDATGIRIHACSKPELYFGIKVMAILECRTALDHSAIAALSWFTDQYVLATILNIFDISACFEHLNWWIMQSSARYFLEALNVTSPDNEYLCTAWLFHSVPMPYSIIMVVQSLPHSLRGKLRWLDKFFEMPNYLVVPSRSILLAGLQSSTAGPSSPLSVLSCIKAPLLPASISGPNIGVCPDCWVNSSQSSSVSPPLRKGRVAPLFESQLKHSKHPFYWAVKESNHIENRTQAIISLRLSAKISWNPCPHQPETYSWIKVMASLEHKRL